MRSSAAIRTRARPMSGPLTVLFALLLTGCLQPRPQTPQDLAERFVRALLAGDEKTAADLLSPSLREASQLAGEPAHGSPPSYDPCRLP